MTFKINAIFIISVLLAACTPAPESSTPSSETSGTNNMIAMTPKVTVKEMMTGAIEPITNALWALSLDENIPQSDEDWKNVESLAIQLLAVSSALAQGGTGPNDMQWSQQPAWQAFTQEIIGYGEQTLNAARAKDYDTVFEATNMMVEPCGGCHNAFPGDSAN